MFDWLIQLLTQESVTQTVIIYGLVIAFGTWLGKLKIFGISLGVTWILFMGLFLSYLGIHVDIGTLHFLKEFGLILFVYCIGLQVGPGFFASLKKNAYVTNGLAVSIVLLGVLITIIFYLASGEPMSVMAGLMSGAVTNTPGLGAAQATVTDLHLAAQNNSMLTLTYALAYPFGVFGVILAMLILKKAFKIDIPTEIRLHEKLSVMKSNKPVSLTLAVENHQLVGQPIRSILDIAHEHIVISRLLHQGQIITPTPDTILNEGDVLLVVAPKSEIPKLKLLIGNESDVNLKEDPHNELASRVIMVTKTEVTHHRLGDIPALTVGGFTLTRHSRAGIEMVPHRNTILQLGDQLKVVGSPQAVESVAQALGNSLKRLEVPDLAPIFIGIVLGALVGSIPFSFPNIPIPIKIGLAGGPLLVSLLLSRYGNVLYLNNYTTNSANWMIRELGITLFLASVGLSSGHNLAQAFAGGHALLWILMSIAITLVPLLSVGFVAKYVFKKTFFEICGLLAGASTDPPALAFATQMAKSDTPSIMYATVYPVVMILRIIVAQLLILFFAS